jgi:hypothetical protein
LEKHKKEKKMKKIGSTYITSFSMNYMRVVRELSWRCDPSVRSRATINCSICGKKILGKFGGRQVRDMFYLVDEENEDEGLFISIGACTGRCSKEIKKKLERIFRPYSSPGCILTLDVVTHVLRKEGIEYYCFKIDD